MLRAGINTERHRLHLRRGLDGHAYRERRSLRDDRFPRLDQVSCPAWCGGHQWPAFLGEHEYLQVSSLCIQPPLRRPPYALGSPGIAPDCPEPMLSDGFHMWRRPFLTGLLTTCRTGLELERHSRVPMSFIGNVVQRPEPHHWGWSTSGTRALPSCLQPRAAGR